MNALELVKNSRSPHPPPRIANPGLTEQSPLKGLQALSVGHSNPDRGFSIDRPGFTIPDGRQSKRSRSLHLEDRYLKFPPQGHPEIPQKSLA